MDSYVAHVMPVLFGASFGLGPAFVPLILTAVHRVAEDRAGVARPDAAAASGA